MCGHFALKKIAQSENDESLILIPFPLGIWLPSVTMVRTTLVAAMAGLARALPQFTGGPYTGMTMLRFGCTNIVIDRLDPLVNPGVRGSPHLHQIVGGDGFNTTMTTADVSKTAQCTSCVFTEDLSNYWTANLYFKARNGTYKRVPQEGHAYAVSLWLIV